MAKFKLIHRLNLDNRWVTYHYALCYPSNTDIAVSSTSGTFEDVVAAYPNSWERASNMPFMVQGDETNPNRGIPLSYVYKNGTQLYAPAPGVSTSRAWAFSVLDANNNLRAIEANPSSGSATSSNDSVLKMKAQYGNAVVDQCKWGVSVGPLPIGGAALSDTTAQAREYPYPVTSNDASDRKEVGIGLLSNGMVLHLACISGYCSKMDIYNVAKEFNPSWFQIFDGGGSMALIDHNDTGTNLGFNYRPRSPLSSGVPRRSPALATTAPTASSLPVTLARPRARRHSAPGKPGALVRYGSNSVRRS